METLKHLPVSEWPATDREAFEAAYAVGDIFDDTVGPGAHLAEGTRRGISTAWRRWLGFLARNHPSDLELLPADRITPYRVRQYVDHLSQEIRLTSVANTIGNLCYGARLIAGDRDWTWLMGLKARLEARATPLNRFNQLIPPNKTLHLGITLMDEAITMAPDCGVDQEVQYRDGLLLALLSLWPVRRRSLAALTVTRHVSRDETGITLLLYPEDTKSRRSESFSVPDQLLQHLEVYLDNIRPTLLGCRPHEGFWASRKGRPMTGQSIYDSIRKRLISEFGKAMSLHDFRRSAASYLAIDAPDKLGWIPGVLQHSSPEIADQHYNLSESIVASQRHAQHVSRMKSRLRSRASRTGN